MCGYCDLIAPFCWCLARW